MRHPASWRRLPVLAASLACLAGAAHAQEDTGEDTTGEPDLDDEPTFDEEPAFDEEIVVMSAADAREIVHIQLEHMGYHRQKRRNGRVIYKNYRRWKPTVIIDDDGWMLVTSRSFVPDRFIVLPLFGAYNGTSPAATGCYAFEEIESPGSYVVRIAEPAVATCDDERYEDRPAGVAHVNIHPIAGTATVSFGVVR